MDMLKEIYSDIKMLSYNKRTKLGLVLFLIAAFIVLISLNKIGIIPSIHYELMIVVSLIIIIIWVVVSGRLILHQIKSKWVLH